MKQSQFHPYQDRALQHLKDHAGAGLFMGMGLGKTAVSLAAINYLMYAELEVDKVLIVAPKTVAQTTWTGERDLWEDFRHITISKVLGSVSQRMAALKVKADIYVINPENIQWLVTHYQTAWPFDMLIVDESSQFKNPSSQRFKAIKMVLPLCKRTVILTGTPIPNGLPDIWSQIYILDRGERLGITITNFRNNYLYAASSDGHIVYKYGVSKTNAEIIYKKIGDICISMKAKDYLTLPDRIEKTVKIEMDSKLMQRYNEFEETEVLKFIDGEGDNEISAVNAAALMNKLLQFSSGSIYVDKERKQTIHIHDEKLDALGEIIEASQGEPILIYYSFRHELERMLKRFGGEQYRDEETFVRWNNGEIPLLYAHPASIAYGLNMQAGGAIVAWLGKTFNLALWDQGNSRLHRQGQTKPVLIYDLVCTGTVDMKARKAIEDKTEGQSALMNAVAALVRKYKAAMIK